jgi:serine/tyrosine/threonine adenylyltransferase
MTTAYRPAPRFLQLGDGLSDAVRAAPFPRHTLRFRNTRAARTVGLDGLDNAAWERHFAAFEPLPDNLPTPLALRYHGHQFGVYNPGLGDGRGFLFAQLLDDRDRLLDLGTKGSGQTPWSRGGDGRLTLKGGVREVLATELLEALGVPTSRSFSLFETGESLVRGDEPSPTRSCVLVRLSHSHIRFGTFQRLAHDKDAARMKRLLGYCIEQYLPEAEGRTAAAFLRAVARRSADLAAAWTVAGFVHGVLNTDNMNVTGESFDYGPYRWLPTYDPDFVAAYFDETGLYAFGRQPETVAWNLTRLAAALRTLDGDGDGAGDGAGDAALGAALEAFEPAFRAAMRSRLLARLGLRSLGPDEDDLLVGTVFDFLEEVAIPFEQLFFDWFGGAASEARALRGPVAEAYASERFAPLHELLRRHDAHPDAQDRLARSPYFARREPCTLLIDEVEAIWSAIAARDDWSAFEAKLGAITEMREALA